MTRRLALKSRVNSRDVHGDALEISYKKLKEIVEGRESDLDQEFQVPLVFVLFPFQHSNFYL